MGRLLHYLSIKANADTLLSLSVMAMRGTSLVSKFVFTLFIARYMGFETLGAYGLIGSASIIASLFFGLTLIHTISRNAVTQTTEEICRNILYYARYISYVYIFLLVPTFLLGIFYDEVTLCFLILIVILLEHINGDFYRLFLNLSKPFLANLLHFIRTAVWMIVFMIAAYITPEITTLSYLLVSWILGSIVAIVGTIIVMRHWPWKKVSFDISLLKWVKIEFKQARNMHITSLLTSISQYWSHFLISIFLGLELTGVYVFFMQVMSALTNLVSTGVIQIARPKLVRAFKDHDENYMNIFYKTLKDTLTISILMALCAWPSLYYIILYLEKPLALEWFPIFPYMLILFIMAMAIEVMKLIFYSHYRDDLILKLSMIGIVLSVILNTAFVILISLWGAVFGQIIAYVIMIILNFVFIKSLLTNTKKDAPTL